MATPTYTALATTTLSSSASSVTFSSIPASYRDLILTMSVSGGNTGAYIKMRFNSDTGSNYSNVRMYGDGSTTASDLNPNSTNEIDAGFLNNTAYAAIRQQIMDYSATDKHKTVLGSEALTGTGYVIAQAARWASTAAITSITLEMASATTFDSGSTFSLYGIEA